MKHARFPETARKAAVHAQGCVVVVYNPQEIYWSIERYFFKNRAAQSAKLRADGSIALSPGNEVARVSSRTVAINIARRFAERYGVRLIITPEPAETWPRTHKGGA